MALLEIRGLPGLTERELGALQMHSLLNLLNVVGGELYLLGRALDRERALDGLRRACDLLSTDLLAGASSLPLVKRFEGFLEGMEAEIARLNGNLQSPEAASAAASLRSIAQISRTRGEDLARRLAHPGAWEIWPCEQVDRGLMRVLEAQAEHARHAYGFSRTPEGRGPGDYLVDLQVRSADGPALTTPPDLLDVLRDLASNARKYSPPGSHLRILFQDDGERLILEVEDDGPGIPEDELPRVVEFGYRADRSNKAGAPKLGFGLTKAWFVARAHGGRMWIESTVGRGTRVRLEVPRSEEGRRHAVPVS